MLSIRRVRERFLYGTSDLNTKEKELIEKEVRQKDKD